MRNIDLEKLSKLVSEKTGRSVVFTEFEKIGSGYHSDGFRLIAKDGKDYFLKYLHSHDLGFEFPERHVASLLTSTGMGKRSGLSPSSVGVLVRNGEEETLLPELDDSTEVFQIQEFGGDGRSFSSIMENNAGKTAIDDEDRHQLSAIADLLFKIHSVKHPSDDPDRLRAVYDDGLRNMLISPELSVMALSEFPLDYKLMDLEGQKEWIGLMYETIRAKMGRPDRLCALHGDFWGANIFFRDDDSLFLIDFSRIPWGDPGIDVGWFAGELLWYYHETGNRYYRDMIELWIGLYEEKSGDKEIRKFMPLVMGWIGIVRTYPRIFPDIDETTGRNFLNHIREILINKEFLWKE